MPKERRNSRIRSERGIYIVASVLILSALILLIILVLGIGFKSGDKILLRNHANLLALAAIEGFVSAPGNLDYAQKADAGLDRANALLSRNFDPVAPMTLKAIGPNPLLGEVGHDGSAGSAGEIVFGQWFEKQPPGADPCSGSGTYYRGGSGSRYPCFLANPAPSAGINPPVNAARLKLKNQSSSAINVPIVGNMGQVEEEAFAIMVPRCLANLMDLSYSTLAETHKVSIGNPGSTTVDAVPADPYISGCSSSRPCPVNPTRQYAGPFTIPRWFEYASGGPRYNTARICPPDCPGPGLPPPSDCNNIYPNFADPVGNPLSKRFYSSLYWCRMEPTRPPGVTDPRLHFRSDYVEEQRPDHFGGPILIDKYRNAAKDGPQPFFRFLSAMNAALRLIKLTYNQGDRAMLAGFTGFPTFVSRVPGIRPDDGAVDTQQLTNEIDYLIQLTNPNNMFNNVYPNFINVNLLPVFSKTGSESHTNLVGPLLNAARSIANINNCTEIAQRSILIATDGIATCRLRPDTAPLLDLPDNNAFECDSSSYQHYLEQENIMLGDLLNYLLQRKISVNVIIDGDALGSHFKDFDDGSGGYLSLEQLRSKGVGIHGNFDNPNDGNNLFDPTPICAGGHCIGTASDPLGNEEAYRNVNLGRSDYVFSRPLLTLGKLALETGGIICPLLKQCSNAALDCPNCLAEGHTSCYDSGTSQLRNCARNNKTHPVSGNPIRTCALTNHSKSEQAAMCAASAVGGNPFALREPVFVAGP